ncbi:MAG: ArsR/SmtB family transcription factor [Halobacteriales archaeon]
MSTEPNRLRRLIRDEIGRCYDEDLEERITDLERIDQAAGAGSARDLQAMAALGDETRHRLVRLLLASDEDRCVCELTPLVPVSESAVSHALSDLVAAGLAERRKHGTWRYYRATERAAAIIDALDSTREAGA